MRKNLKPIAFVCFFSFILVTFTGCGNVLSHDDDARSTLFNLTLETFSPTQQTALAKASSFLQPTDMISLADNPMVAIMWVGAPVCEAEWETALSDTMYVATDIKPSWPLRISFNLKDPPAELSTLKDHPESKAAVGFFVIFNDGNHNGKYDNYKHMYQDTIPEYIMPFGPYDYFRPTDFSKDTVYSKPLQSLTALKEDWIIGFSHEHGIVYASDQRACDWLNRQFTCQEIADKQIAFETRYASQYEGYKKLQPTDIVQFFQGITPGYNLVNSKGIIHYSEPMNFGLRQEFNPITKQWKVFTIPAPSLVQFNLTGAFMKVDESSTIVPIIITDDSDEYFTWCIWDS